MWNLKIQQTSEYNIKEAGSQIQRTNWWLPVERRERQHRGGGVGGAGEGGLIHLQDMGLGGPAPS